MADHGTSVIEALLSAEEPAVATEEPLSLAAMICERHAHLPQTTQAIPTIARRRRTSSLVASSIEPAESIEMKRGLRLLAHAHMLKRRTPDVPNSADVRQCVAAMIRQATSSGDSDVSPATILSYDEFCAAAQLCPALGRLVSASTFLKLPRDAAGGVPLRHLAHYVRARVHLANAWLRLALYDSEGDGCLREHDMENYVFESIPELPELASLQENFYPFYVFTAVRKFFFFLDANRTGRVRITDILSSPVLREWLALFPLTHAHMGGAAAATAVAADTELDRRVEAMLTSLDEAAGGGGAVAGAAASPTAPPVALTASNLPVDEAAGMGPRNWFAAATAIRVYTEYLDLDADQNGLLSRAELAAARGGTLTDAFVGRLFQEVNTYGGEMDFKAYLDFVLATECRQSPQSQRYLFRCLDVRHAGRITRDELRFFLGDVSARMAAAEHEPLDVASVCDEVLDMIRPAVPGVVTPEDLRRCRLGHTVLHMLTDAAGFWAYDNREALLQQQQQAAAAAADGGAASPAPLSALAPAAAAP